MAVWLDMSKKKPKGVITKKQLLKEIDAAFSKIQKKVPDDWPAKSRLDKVRRMVDALIRYEVSLEQVYDWAEHVKLKLKGK